MLAARRLRGPAGATRCSSAAAPRRCSAATAWRRCSTRSATRFVLRRRRRGHHRGQPGVDVAGVLRPHPGGRLHPGVAGHAVGGAARAARPRPHALARPGARRGRARRGRPGSSTSTSTSSTARRGRPTTTCDRSVDAALGAGVDHVSAYALIVEDGTALARRVRRGELPAAGRRRARAPLRAARRAADARPASTGTRCRTGPAAAASAGTTSATGTAATGGAPGPARTATSAAMRWWNVKHPDAYARPAGRRAAARRRPRGARRAEDGTPRT